MTVSLKMTVAQLREELATRGLDSSGLKPALVSRLQEAMALEAGAGAAAAGERERGNSRSTRPYYHAHLTRGGRGVNRE